MTAPDEEGVSRPVASGAVEPEGRGQWPVQCCSWRGLPLDANVCNDRHGDQDALRGEAALSGRRELAEPEMQRFGITQRKDPLELP